MALTPGTRLGVYHVVFVSNFGDYLRTTAPGNK